MYLKIKCRPRQISKLWLLVAILPVSPELCGDEPRFFPQETQVPGEIFSESMWGGNQRVSRVAYHNGFLYTSTQNFTPRVRVWDIQDPRNPLMLHEFLSVNSGHNYGILGDRIDFNNRDDSFDASDPLAPQRVDGGLTGSGAGRVFYYPFLFSFASAYASGTPASFTISDQRSDTDLATFDPVTDAGVVGKPIAIGNLLIYAALNNSSGVATYDISDPTNPVFLDSIEGVGGYEPSIWRHYVVLTHEDDAHPDMRGMTLVDFSDPTNLRNAGHMSPEDIPGVHRYTQFQDQYGFTGWAKIDMETLTVAQEYPLNRGITDEYSLPLGNLIAFGQFSGRCWIIAHQSEPDTLPPTVAYHLPADGAVEQAVTSRIGIVIHETLASETVRYGESVIVRPFGGETIPGILYRNDLGILQFTPDEDLIPGTIYEVLLPAGGIHDVSGNPIEEYRFTFTTAGGGPVTRPVINEVALSPTPVAPQAPVSVTVTADHPLGETLEYRYDWGDGSPVSEWSRENSASYQFEENGHYQIGVQVRDEGGKTANRTLIITVTDASARPEAPRSSPIILGPGGQYVWCVNPDNNSIARIATDDHSVDEFATAAGPVSLAIAPDGNVWVSCRDADQIQIHDPDTGEVLDVLEMAYGSAPQGLLIDSQVGAAYVACHGSGVLMQFNTVSRLLTASLAIGPEPRALALSPDRRQLLVTRFRSPNSGGEVTRVDLTSFSIANRHQLAVDPGPDSPSNGRGLPNYLVAANFTRAGDRAFVAAVKANVKRGLARDGLELTHESTVRALVASLAPEDDLEGRFDIDNSDSPAALWVSPHDDYLLVALQGNNQVMIVDLLDGSTGVRMAVGAAPQGICYDPGSGKLFVKNFLDRTVTIYSFDPFLRHGRLPAAKLAEPSTVGIEALSSEVLQGKQIFYHASDERMALEGYVSCASCHLDGGHDGLVWDFTDRGEGLRNTTDLRGRGGMDHGLVHWSGNFDEIQDFEHDIRNAFGGTGFLSDAEFNEGTRNAPLGDPKAGLDADLDALAAYVSSLDESTLGRSPHRMTDGNHSTAAIAGAKVFRRMDCVACHRPDREFTDSSLGAPTSHDVGTLRDSSGRRLGETLSGIDTPTLLGLWDTAPYLHDGSADTLESVFQIAGGQTLQAESGVLSGAGVVANSNGGFVVLDAAGETVSLTGVDGGSGGGVELEMRATSTSGSMLQVSVGEQSVTVTIPAERVPNDWRRIRVSGLGLAAGSTNTVEITFLSGGLTGLDAVLVSTPEELARAHVHRRAWEETTAMERQDLIAFLLELDQGWNGQELFPSPPTALEAVAVDADQINLVFLDATTLETGYRVEMRPLGGSWQGTNQPAVSGSGEPVFLQFDGLTGGITYEFRVAAQADDQQTIWAGPVTATPLVAPGGERREILPIQDAYVENGNGQNDNFLKVEDQRRTSYMMFDLPDFGADLLEVRLRFTVVEDGNNRGGTLDISLGDTNEWTEGEINGTNAPVAGTLLASVDGNRAEGQTYDEPLDGLTPGVHTLVLEKIAGGDFWMSSSEGTSPPVLVLLYADGEVIPLTGPEISGEPVDATVAYGDAVTLSAAATGHPIMSYRWYRNGVPLTDGLGLTGTHTDTLTILSAVSSSDATYRLDVQDVTGIVTSREATVQVTGTTVLDQWRENFFEEAELFDPSISGMDADPDYDTVPNLLEFLRVSDPWTREPGDRPGLLVESSMAHFEFQVRIDSGPVTYEVNFSSDLDTWFKVPPENIREISRENGIRRMRASVPLNGENQAFFVLEATAAIESSPRAEE